MGRPDFTPEKPFTPKELAEIRRNFAMLSPSSLQTAYSEAFGTLQAGQGWPTAECGAYPNPCAGVEAVKEDKVRVAYERYRPAMPSSPSTGDGL